LKLGLTAKKNLLFLPDKVTSVLFLKKLLKAFIWRKNS
jgi:uncharacterized membrane protein YpjA